MRTRSVDKIFLSIVLLLSFAGLFIFSSAALGIMTDGINSFLFIVIKQLTFGLVLGLLAMYFTSIVDYKKWQKYAPYIFIASMIITLLVFVPSIGVESLGARRWINVIGVSFQPSEFLKFGFIVYFATWLHNKKSVIRDFKTGTLPALSIMAIPTSVLLLQPDNGTLISVLIAAISMYILAGGRWLHLLAVIFSLVVLLGLIISFKPYVLSRIKTFIDPLSDPLGSGYQIRQSLIAIGSGGLAGRGFGQSIQKFNFLPEPVGDSIFAVFSEEFGFIGSSSVVLLFLALALRGFRIAKRAPDSFGGLLVMGIVILIVSQSYVNIGAMLGLFPLTGIPLIFISHGGSALFFSLAEIGAVLSVSRVTNNN